MGHKTSAKRVAKMRAARKKAGLQRVEVEAYPPDVTAIKAHAKDLQAEREKDQ